MNHSTEILVKSIITNPEFQKLQYIGGGKQYHQEGSAFVHSLLVFQNSFEFWQDDVMNIVALLHDIGKIYTGRPKANGDWEYPNHAKIGAENLFRFLPEETDGYDFIQFCIANHIKPLFWKEYPPYTIRNISLAKLAICDLKGSISAESQDDKIQWLYNFIQKSFSVT